jgi:hypothetical protein
MTRRCRQADHQPPGITRLPTRLILQRCKHLQQQQQQQQARAGSVRVVHYAMCCSIAVNSSLSSWHALSWTARRPDRTLEQEVPGWTSVDEEYICMHRAQLCINMYCYICCTYTSSRAYMCAKNLPEPLVLQLMSCVPSRAHLLLQVCIAS